METFYSSHSSISSSRSEVALDKGCSWVPGGSKDIILAGDVVGLDLLEVLAGLWGVMPGVVFHEGVLVLDEVQREGGKRLSGRDFVNGLRGNVAERVGLA